MKKNPTLRERITELEVLMNNTQMATNMSQVMIKNMIDAEVRMDKDIAKIVEVVNDLQYKILSVIESGLFDKDKLNKSADSFKLIDFDKACEREDKDKGYITCDTVTPESIITVTSTTNSSETDGIFRSRLTVENIAIDDLKERVVGCKVGDHISSMINDVMHDIEILDIKQLPPSKEDNDVPLATESNN